MGVIIPVELNILGTIYKTIKKNYSDDQYFSDYCCNGYRDSQLKEIVLCDLRTHPVYKNESDKFIFSKEKITFRHEIIHAYLSESGLEDSSFHSNCWALNEEMVDWFAIQSPKILRTFAEANCI